MVYTIENDQLLVQIQSKGSELSSIRPKKNGIEYVWQADPKVWGRHAPVLFPVVGKLRDNQYQWQGNTYSLSQHGFARDQQFELLRHTQDSVTLVLKASVDTHKIYPFPFELRITHTLAGNAVNVLYQVINHGDGEMPFSIGTHPGFNCPLLPGESFEDYFLEFSTAETLETHLLEGGLFSGKTEPFINQAQTLPLTRELFAKDAIVVKNFKSQSLSLKSHKNPHCVKVSFAGFPYLGIWTKDAHSPFLCIEPWFGLADHSAASGQLNEKEGIIVLKGKTSFQCLHSIEVE